MVSGIFSGKMKTVITTLAALSAIETSFRVTCFANKVS